MIDQILKRMINEILKTNQLVRIILKKIIILFFLQIAIFLMLLGLIIYL